MRCPICKTSVEDASPAKPNSAYPFCSERCKLIDLGRWLDGKHQIPAEAAEDAGSAEADADRPMRPRAGRRGSSEPAVDGDDLA